MVLGQGVQVASPALLKVLAGQVAHTVWLVGEQADASTEPAPQTVQFWHGARPEALKVRPAAQAAGKHLRLELFQA